MNLKNSYYYLTLLILMYSGVLEAQNLKVFSTIPGRAASDKYVCKVREVGNTTWQSAFVVQTKSDYNPSDPDNLGADNGFFKELVNWTHSYIAFESNYASTIEVEITKINGTITEVPVIRPAGEATATISGGKAYVRFSKAANVYVDIDGQMENKYTGAGYTSGSGTIGKGAPIHAITIFANPFYLPPSTGKVITLQPNTSIRTIDRAVWDAVIFAPGIHNIGTQLDIQTGEIFYIPGDAILKGTFLTNSDVQPQNIQIYGSGAISGEALTWNTDAEEKNKVFTGYTGGARLEGFVVIDPTNHTFNMNNSGTVTNVYKNLKILGWRKNGDGLNAFKNSEVSECFFRTQDDAFYLGYNVKIHNNTTWTDANGAVMFLAKSDANSYFKDIKVIYNRKKYHGWNSGVISMRNTDGNITNVLCQNINVEDPFPTVGLFYGTIKEGTFTFSNIVFDNITQAAMRQDGKKMDLLGTSSSNWKNITIKNSKYEGKCLNSLDDGNWNYNTYVDKASIKFECGTSTSQPVTGVTIDNCPSVGLPVNDTKDLSSTVLPDNATNQGITWASSDPAIATINASSGVVTAKAVGTANMTVKTTEGNFIKTCTISVIAATAPNVVLLGGTTDGWLSVLQRSPVSGSNRLLVVMVTGEHSAPFTVSSVKYGTKTMQKEIERTVGSSVNNYTSIFTLKESDLSAAGGNLLDVQFINATGTTMTTKPTHSVSSAFLGNVNQTTPTTNKVSHAVLSGTTISTASVSSASGDLLLYGGATSADNLATPNNGFTETFESNSTWGDGVGGSKLSTGVSEMPQFSQSASGRMVLCALAVKKSSGSATARVSQSTETLSVDENLIPSNAVKVYPNPVSNILTIESVSKSEKEISVVNTLGQVVYRTKSNSQNTQIDIRSLNVSGFVIVQVITDGTVSNHKVIVK